MSDGLPAGELVDGRYRVEAPLAEGGMGVVYLARHEALGRKVALKVLRRDLTGDAELVRRFEQEARGASNIGHPNIVDIFDLGRCADGRPYMAMELLDGVTLAQRLVMEGQLPWPLVIALGAQILAALGAAHAHGIVHRDLKPDNVFLVPATSAEPLVKLLDFGISKFAQPGLGPVQTTTIHGTVMGTMGYMSPEQARGQTGAIDHRTDLYATGVVLYEMLCGALPFDGESYNAMLAAILEHRFEPVAARRPDAPQALADVITRALATDRDARHASADEMRAALLAVRAPLAELELELELEQAPPPPASLEVVGLDRWSSGAPEPPPEPSAPPEAPAPPSRPPSARVASVPARITMVPSVRTGTLAPPPGRREPAPPPSGTRSQWPLAALALLAAGGAGWWFVIRPTRAAMTLHLKPPDAAVLLDGVALGQRPAGLLPGTAHTLIARAAGFVTVEHRFVFQRGDELDVRLPHELPVLDERDLPLLPPERVRSPAQVAPPWDELHSGVSRVERGRACLVSARRDECAAVHSPVAATERAAEAYVHALAERDAGRPSDVTHADTPLRAALWAERDLLDADELEALDPGGASDAWRVRRLLVGVRAALRPGADLSRLHVPDKLRLETAPELEAAANELLGALQAHRGALEAYNRLVRRYNAFHQLL